MREWRGLKVPVEPKKEWEWMGDGYSQPICADMICVGINCRDCIYSHFNTTARKQFYKECFQKNPKKLPQRDAKGRFRKKGVAEMMYYWEGLKVPVDPMRAWGQWMCSEIKPCPWTTAGIKCEHGKIVTCSECVYARRNSEARRRFYEQYYGKWPTPGKSEYPKLTVEVFNRSNCPKWAQWAAVDGSGKAYWYRYRPRLLEEGSSEWLCSANEDFGGYCLIGKSFDSSDWEHSLIERPQKELPKLTQTAFHCPDCPKEATKLKVFPANHVVALDKDDKVLSVMELQCKEGEVSRVRAEWYYNKESDILYYGKECEYTEPPVGVVPVNVFYLPSDVLEGTAVHEVGVAEDFLIVDVKGSLVTLVGVKGKNRISMVTLILNYRITCSGSRCCVIEPLQ